MTRDLKIEIMTPPRYRRRVRATDTVEVFRDGQWGRLDHEGDLEVLEGHGSDPWELHFVPRGSKVEAPWRVIAHGLWAFTQEATE